MTAPVCHCGAYMRDHPTSYGCTLGVEMPGEPEIATGFHAHLNECVQCCEHPFALCAEGARALEAEVFNG